MATLWNIDSRIRDFQFEVDPETGEILNADALDGLSMERDAKIENIALYIKNLTADAKAIRDEEAALKKRRETAERNAERLKRYLANSLQGQKFSTPRVAVSYRKATSVQVDNVELAIATLQNGGYTDALRYKPPEINKAEVKRLLSDGVEIPGVQMVETLSMSIR